MTKHIPVNDPVSDCMTVFSPTTWSCKLTNGPPEFLGLIVASIWIMSISSSFQWFRDFFEERKQYPR
jgi:hypothetical protein